MHTNTLQIEEDRDIAKAGVKHGLGVGAHRQLLDLWDASDAGPGKEWDRPDALRTQGSNEAVGECQDDCFKE